MSAKPPSAFYSNMAGGARAATTKSSRVTGLEGDDVKAESLNNKNLASLILEGFPTSNMTVSQAKSFESVPLSQTFEIWTHLENVSAFSAIMPVVQTNSLHMEGQNVIHQTAMTQQAPERVRAFTLEQKRTRYQTTLQRYHIGVEVTTFSLDTDEGRALYINDLKAMRLSYYESNAIRSIVELQTCLSPWRDPTKRYGNHTVLTSDTLRQALQMERDIFALAQRETNSLELLDTFVSRAQSKVQGARGDTYILDKDIITYQNQVPKDKQNYSIGGPDKVAEFRKGTDSITMDLRGNTIVTFKSYRRDGEDPFQPLMEVIDYMEYYTFRDMKYGSRYEADHEDAHRMVMIWDVDKDQWFGVTTEFVIKNCHRFDPTTGMPYGLKSQAVDRHDIEYSAAQFNDSYHYTVKEGAKTMRKPCLFMGQISQEHIPLAQIIQKGGEHTVMKMRDLKAANLSDTTIRNAIAAARALLIQIESVAMSADVAAYLDAALPNAAAATGANTASVFGANYLNRFYPVNPAFGGVNLPIADPTAAQAPAWLANARAIRVPVGFGSYAGFKAIQAAWAEVGKTDATFVARTGLDASVARTVNAFLDVFEAFVNYAVAFYPHSLGVDASQASPWWVGATAAHAIFDTVVTPQHRLPILVDAGQAGLVSTPLVYTPRMAAAIAGNTFAGSSRFRLLNPAANATALTEPPAGLAAALRGDASLFAGLDPAFVPISHTFESPALTGSVVNNYIRNQAVLAGLNNTGAAAVNQTMMDDTSTDLARGAVGKRSASAMAAGGRVLASFGGGNVAVPVAEAKRARGIGVTPAVAMQNLANELQNENLVSTWDQVDADSSINDLDKWCIKLYLLSPFNSKVLLNWARRNLWVPVGAILFRCATLGTQTVLKVAAGACGKQFIAFPTFRWNIDGILGVLRAQLDYFFAAKVTDTRLVFQADNFFMQRYFGGLGSKPVSSANITPTSSATSISVDRPSIYVALEPYARQSYDDVVSITGRKRDVGTRMGIPIQDNDELDYTNAAFHNLVYGHQKEVLQARKVDFDFWPGSSPVLAHRGLHKVYDRVLKTTTKTVGGTGYLPDSWIGQGLKHTLNGALKPPVVHSHDVLVENGV